MIHIENLVKRYGDLVALNHLNLDIKEGEIFGLLGPNGSGKTTAINCLLSLLKYDKGEIYIFGQKMTPDNYEVKQQIGIVLQNVAVFDELTVSENIDYFCGLYIHDKNRRRELVEEAIQFAGLEDYRKTRPQKLSGGLLRRLNIACGIAHKPRLIILDEPTVAVDPQSRNKILEGIQELNRQGSTIIYTSHYMEEVEQICTRIAIMDHGRVIASGTTEELKKMIKTGETITVEALLLTEKQLQDIRNLPHVFDVHYEDQILTLRCTGAQHNLIRLLNYLQNQDISFGQVSSELPTLNDVNDLIETGFVQSSLRHTISLHPMIQEIAVSETAPSVTSCHTLLDSLRKICLMHGIEVSYYKKLFQTVENIMLFIEKDDIPQYLLFLEDVFPYMEKYHYQKGMKKIIQELQHFIKASTYGTASDRALLLDYQATLEPKTEKAIKLEKEALAQIKETTKENAHLVSNLHSNLGGLYRINGQLDLAKRHMKMGISLLQQYQLLYTNDSIPQINNYAVLLIEIQEPDLALSALQKLAQIIKEYNSNHCLDYAQVQESLGSICLITANISQAKTHFKKALKIYEDIWADEPELIEEKYQAIQELYPQAGIALAKSILLTKH